MTVAWGWAFNVLGKNCTEVVKHPQNKCMHSFYKYSFCLSLSLIKIKNEWCFCNDALWGGEGGTKSRERERGTSEKWNSRRVGIAFTGSDIYLPVRLSFWSVSVSTRAGNPFAIWFRKLWMRNKFHCLMKFKEKRLNWIDFTYACYPPPVKSPDLCGFQINQIIVRYECHQRL